VALVTRISGFAPEIGDPDAEFGMIPVLLLFVILSGYVLFVAVTNKVTVQAYIESEMGNHSPGE
jgi:hypothetical protein